MALAIYSIGELRIQGNEMQTAEQEKRDHVVTVRLTPSEFHQLVYLSGTLETSRANLMQDAISKYLRQYRPLRSATNTYPKK